MFISISLPPSIVLRRHIQIRTIVTTSSSHGKFRPTLKGLIQQNAVNVVQETTAAGYKVFTGAGPSARESLNILTKLKGVGPATASLLLSVYDRATAPFFSDEMFRWCFFDDAKGKGWDREMKYNLKEYIELFAKVQELRDRFGREFEREVSAVEVEKVAYVLGKQDSVVAGGEGSRGKKRKGEEEGNEAKKVGKVGVVAEKASDVEGGSAKRAQVKGKEGAAASRPRRNRK